MDGGLFVAGGLLGGAGAWRGREGVVLARWRKRVIRDTKVGDRWTVDYHRDTFPAQYFTP